MINLGHNYALLEDGTIEPLWYGKDHSDFENRRTAYKGEDGKYYLDHDKWKGNIVFFCHHKIVKTANTKKELETNETDMLFYVVGSFNGDSYLFTDKSEAIEKAEHTDTGRVEVYWLKNNDLRHLETLYEDENWGEGIQERED